MCEFAKCMYPLKDFEQIYHVWEGYLQKIPVERRKISRADRRGKFSLKTGFFSRPVFFANTPPKHDISVQNLLKDTCT
jgi:transposase